ncbi:MAG: selenium cofactor biosynthesis protein YqeC, partial [Chloroflexota bacterium]|nr:selenium cofactor biosynthesis protein YqeC [Chloroflexota bacterium]
PHEPVIPMESTHVVALVGADVFGKPLSKEHVHRPELVARLGGVAMGTPITPDLVARILTHRQGGLQYVPDTVHFLPFLNKVEDPADAIQAEEMAQLLLEHPRVREVILGSLHELRGGEQSVTADRQSTPRLESGDWRVEIGEWRLRGSRLAPISRRSRSAAVVLAAGMATRFGETKQLLDWRGKALVAHVAEVALEVCETVLVVVGHEADQVARAVDHLPVEVIFNEHFASGQGSSVAAGVAALMEMSRPFIGEAFFLLADQPLVTPGLLRQLRAVRGLHRIAVPRYGGQHGNPVLFDVALFPTLRDSRGDVGGRALFAAHREEIAWLDVADEAVLRDVDTPEDWESFG